MTDRFFTSEQIYKIDKLATEKFLIPSIILMENAGRSVAEFVKKYITTKIKKVNKILLFCGPGKNGGDGFVCARYLHIWGFNIKVVSFVSGQEYSGDTLLNYKILKKLAVEIEKFNADRIKKEIKNYDIIIDAIFGIGLKRSVEGKYRKAIELINNSCKTVIAVDIPSGLNADTGEVMGIAVKSNFTITMGFMKKGFINKKAKQFLGRVVVIDIGYPPVITKYI